MDEKRLDEIDEALEKNNITLSDLCTQDEEPELIRLARMGLKWQAAEQNEDYTLVFKKGGENPGEELLIEFIRYRALAEWAEKHGVPALKLIASDDRFREGDYSYQFVIIAKDALEESPKTYEFEKKS